MTDTQPIATPDDLDYHLAVRSYANTSFHPEERARSDQQTYADDVNGLHAELLKLAATDQQKELLAEEIERYRQGYLQRYTEYLASHARCASWAITGPARFPVARQQKYGRWADKKRDTFLQWRGRARGAIRRKLLDARPEEAKDDDRWQALAAEIKRSLAVIEGIDAGREPYTRSAFVNSIAGKVERLVAQGETSLVEKALDLVRSYNEAHDKPAISARHTFWTFGELAPQKAAQLDAAATQEPETIADSEGVKIIANAQADRVQIVFAAKPSIEIIGRLKGEGWHWSRSEGAWQRKLTEAAKYSARQITGLA